MNRNTAKNLIAACGLAISAFAPTAMGVGVVVDHPSLDVGGNIYEYVGDNSIILFSDDEAAVAAGAVVSVSVRPVAVLANGGTVSGGAYQAVPQDFLANDISTPNNPVFNVLPVAAANDVNGAIDLGGFLQAGAGATFATNLSDTFDSIGTMFLGNEIVGVAIQIQIVSNGSAQTFESSLPTTAPTAAATAESAGLAGVSFEFDEAVQSPQYIAPPVISEASVDTVATPTVNFVFNRVLNSGAAGNNANQLVLATINEDDFTAGVSATTGVVFGPNDNVLRVTFADAAGKPSVGSSLGFENEDSDGNTRAAAGSIFDAQDFVGYELSDLGAQTLAAIVPLEVVSAEFREIVTPNAANVGSALAVTFNKALSNAGTADAYALVLGAAELAGGTGFTFANPTIDPTDATTVLLDVDSQSLETGVTAQGLNDDNATGADALATGLGNDANDVAFTARVFDVAGGATTAPTDAIGVAFDAPAGNMPANSVTTASATDGIAPTLVDETAHDLDGDGTIDAVALTFNEPMQAPSSLTGFTVVAINGSTVQPVSGIGADGELPAATALALAGATNLTLDLSGSAPAVAGNSVAVSNLDLSGLVDAMMNPALPSSGDTSNFQISYDPNAVGAAVVQDLAGNAFETTVTSQVVDTDMAPPALVDAWFLTGDNIIDNTDNDQEIAEQDGTLGDQSDNDRLTLVFSEDLDAGVNAGATDETQIGWDGTLANNFQGNGDFLDLDGNRLTFVNAGDTTGYMAGVTVTVGASSGIVDADGNEVSEAVTQSEMVDDRDAPYIAYVDADPSDSAFLIDTDGDGRAELLVAQFNDDIVAGVSGINVADFTDQAATVMFDSATINGRNLELAINSATEPTLATDVTVVYNAPQANTNTRLLEGPTGNAIQSGATTTFTAEEIEGDDVGVQTPAVMLISGNATNGVDGGNNPIAVPLGTRIYAMVATPVVSSITATHNNIPFTYNTSNIYSASEGSREAFTSWLLGLRSNVYLHRYAGNEQIFTNQKDDAEALGGDGDDFPFALETISIDANASNLSSIRFTGRGESNQNRVTNGTISLHWDVFRADGGLYEDLFDDGWDFGDQPIISSTVVTELDGSYNLAVSGPASAFNGINRLSALGNPVIIVVELPSGERFAASSINTSVNGGPLLFSPNNRTQNNDGSAADATDFDINLNNVGQQQIQSGWNTVPFAQAGGWASASNRRPELPNGVTENDVVIGSGLIAAGALDQFVYWDDNGDGDWTAADDGAGTLSSIIVDANAIPHFAFTMTDSGVQFGSGITNLVGGYAFGFFNSADDVFGVNQFGAPLSSATVFDADAFSNSNSNQGWALVTVTSNFPAAGDFFTGNSDADFLLRFFNEDGTLANFVVESLEPSGSASNPNDLTTIESGSAFFVHYDN